jgi:hypothetical protein
MLLPSELRGRIEFVILFVTQYSPWCSHQPHSDSECACRQPSRLQEIHRPGTLTTGMPAFASFKTNNLFLGESLLHYSLLLRIRLYHLMKLMAGAGHNNATNHYQHTQTRTFVLLLSTSKSALFTLT